MQDGSTSTSSGGGNIAPTVPLTAHEAQLKQDRQKFLQFAEKHRTVLNQILRQSATHLSDGPFAVLVDHTRILDFDVKRKYFQTELERLDEGIRREEHTVSVRRVTVFEDSFRVLYRLGPEEWKNRFYIVFEGECVGGGGRGGAELKVRAEETESNLSKHRCFFSSTAAGTLFVILLLLFTFCR